MLDPVVHAHRRNKNRKPMCVCATRAKSGPAACVIQKINLFVAFIIALTCAQAATVMTEAKNYIHKAEERTKLVLSFVIS